MIDWLLDGEVKQFFWARQISTTAMLAAFAVVVLLTVFLYRRGQGLPLRVRLVLAASRLVALSLIVAVVLEPTVAVTRTDTVKRRLPVLIDVSGSMSVMDQRKRSEDIVEAAAALGMLPLSETTDANRAAMALDAKQRQTIAAASRLDLARSLLSQSARPAFESLGDDLDVSYYAFGKTLHKLGEGNSGNGGSGTGDFLATLQADESGTSIAESLEAVANSDRGVPLAGIVLISDGLDTSSRGAEVAVQVLRPRVAELAARMPAKQAPDLSRYLLSPMPGLLVKLAVAAGQEVKSGEVLAVVEAMKMENVLRATRDGTIATLHAEVGASLAVDQPILEFA